MHVVKDRFYKAGSSIKLSCTISEDYILSLTTQKPVTTSTSTITTPFISITELATETTTARNRLEIMLNESWSIATPTITTTVGLRKTTQPIQEFQKVTQTISATQTAEPLHNIYGLEWKKQGKKFIGLISWHNIRQVTVLLH